MLVCAAGMSLRVLEAAPWEFVLGFLVTGVAVGAEIPASWSLIAETDPTKMLVQLEA